MATHRIEVQSYLNADNWLVKTFAVRSCPLVEVDSAILYIDLSELRQLPDWEIVRSHNADQQTAQFGQARQTAPLCGCYGTPAEYRDST